MKIFISTQVSGYYLDCIKSFDLELFKALSPPFMPIKILQFEGSSTGNIVEVKLGVGRLSTNWKSKITNHGNDEKKAWFIDEGLVLPFPLTTWTHNHLVYNVNANTCTIVDDISYSTNYKLLDVLIFPIMYFTFWLRKPSYKKYFS